MLPQDVESIAHFIGFHRNVTIEKLLAKSQSSRRAKVYLVGQHLFARKTLDDGQQAGHSVASLTPNL